MISLEAKFLLPNKLSVGLEASSLAPVGSTQHFPWHGQTATLNHIFIQEDFSILCDINISFLNIVHSHFIKLTSRTTTMRKKRGKGVRELDLPLLPLSEVGENNARKKAEGFLHKQN